MKSTNEKILQFKYGLIVLRDIDCGREQSFWLAPYADRELEEWWSAQDSFDHNPDGLFDSVYAMFGEQAPPRREVALPGEFIPIESDADLRLWLQLADGRKHYSCNICCDEDSYLKRPDGTMVRHRGFKQREA